MQFVPVKKDSCSSQLEENFELMFLGKANERKKGKFYEVNVQKNLCNIRPQVV